MGFLLDIGENVIIDEVQRAPEIFLSLKKLIDDNRNRRIILTGSANVMLQPKVADSLAGRIETHHLWPFSVDEINGRKSVFLDNLINDENNFESIPTRWEEIIELIRRGGGYPEVVTVSRKAEEQNGCRPIWNLSCKRYPRPGQY